ncbi:MAG: dTMP kinase [Synergistaceae bacterium]|nr:dTMP kinase [Synergistaceae bacterium]MBQ6971650.1 dTMP kinase [Synergistaceae bacterium]
MFITLEGIDGSGKSTQSEKIAEWLESRTGRRTVRTFEPGGWQGGGAIRGFILNTPGLSAMSELLLFLADRSEHISRVILPALRQDCNVLCERWNESTLAYQAGGHELNPSHVRRIIRACSFPEPDVKILLDISPETAIERVKSRKNSPDKFEDEGIKLLRNVAAFYRLIAEEDPAGFVRVVCDGLTEDEVFTKITAGLEARLWRSR